MEIMNTNYFVVGFFWCVPIALDELAAVAMVNDVKWKVWEENMEIIPIWYYLEYLINQK
jgi:hypothetical protein